MHTQEIATSQSEPLWHIGRFACALSLQSEPPFLAVLKDDESILEVTVHSALEAKERADALRVIVQQYLVTDEPTGDPQTALSGYPRCPSCGTPNPIAADDASTELVMRCRCCRTWRGPERRSGRRYRLGHSRTPSIRGPVDTTPNDTE